MKKIIYILLGLYSITSFGQSDLEFQSYYAGAPGATHYKGEQIDWAFNVINNGVSSASVLDYKIYLSENELIDSNDLILKEGKISKDQFTNLLGLEVNDTAHRDPIHSGFIDIPLNIEANKTYYFIFWIEQDANNGETNITNNVVTQSVNIGLKNKLSIYPVDFNDLNDVPCITNNYGLDNRTPLLLIHGWQPKGVNAEGNINIWNNFLRYFACDEELKNQYKPYYVKYYSNIVTVDDLGHELRIELDNNYIEFHDRQISIVAHSMGGLVSRSFLNRNRLIGPFSNQKGGERVDKLITLGSPHHGSPVANGNLVTDISSYNLALFDDLIFNLNYAWDIINYSLYGVYSIPLSTKVNRWDLRWDNYDGYFDYSLYPNEQNIWLNSNKMNGDTAYDNKIIAYAGGIFNPRDENSIDNNTISIGYFEIEKLFNSLGHVNDGVVPFLSAIYQGHVLDKVRPFSDYYHDEIAKGKFDNLNSNGLDIFLFDFLKEDLLGNLVSSHISSAFLNYQFPETAIGNNSSKEIVVTNTGDLDLTISSIQLVGIDNAQFNFNFPTVPFTILPNGTQTFTVDFSPTSIGNKTVTFRVNNSSVNNPQLDIQLNGLAVQTATTDYSTNTGSSYDFGDVYVYGGSGLTTMSISNSTSAPYIINNIDIVGTDASMFEIVQQSNLPITLNPGDIDNTILSFDPDSIGEKNAVIEIHFESFSIPVAANLIGNGVNTINNPNTPKLTNYEYWYNNDYASKQSINLTGINSAEQLDFSASPLNTTNGLNKLHFRIKDSNGSWSSVSSDYTYIQNATNGTSENQINTYEYWFDSDYNNKVTGNGSGTNPLILNLNANVNALEKGLHQFHIRFKDEKGGWSSIVSEFIYNNKPEGLGNNMISAYRYWFNDDFDNRVSETVSLETNYMFLEDINISGLTNNSTNYIHFQFKDIYNNWSSVLTEEFLFETLSINEPNAERLKLYPNPTNSIIYITTKVLDGQLVIYDNLGKLIQEFDIIPNQIDISNYESGLYFFQIKSENKVYQEKVIKF